MALYSYHRIDPVTFALDVWTIEADSPLEAAKKFFASRNDDTFPLEQLADDFKEISFENGVGLAREIYPYSNNK